MAGIFRSPHPLIPESNFPKTSLTDLLFTNASTKYSPNSTAFIDGITGETVSIGDFQQECLLLAAAFQQVHQKGLLRLSRGGTACIFSPNSLVYPKVMFALNAAGIVGAYANSTYVGNELAHSFKISTSSHMIVDPALLQVAIDGLKSAGLPEHSLKQRIILMAYKKDIPADVASQNWLDLDSLVAGVKPLSKPEPFDGEKTHETTAIFFSSGTTGLSKAVEITHFNIIAFLIQLRTAFAPDVYRHGIDVMMTILPLFHVFGASLITINGYFVGCAQVILPRFEPTLFLQSIERFKITIIPLVPPLLNFLCKSPEVDKYDVSSVRTIIIGAAPVAPAAIVQAIEQFRKRGSELTILHGYGLTESTAAMTSLAREHMITKAGSIGVLVPNSEGRLVDEDGNDVPIGSPGELWVRGPNIMKGYFGNPKATAEVLTPDRWFKTGDVAVRDEGGFLTIVDRKKELIKYKGFQVAPAELEAVLFSHPVVADAGVIGVYSEKEVSEVPMAYVVPKDLSLVNSPQKGKIIEEILAWVKTQVAPHKELRGGIVLVDVLPRSASGKILRKDLRLLQQSQGNAKARL